MLYMPRRMTPPWPEQAMADVAVDSKYKKSLEHM